MAETSAAVEPEMPEKRISATTTTIARPPRTFPTIAIARSTMRSEIPPDLHQRAGQDEERDGEQHERVDAAEDLDRKNDQADAADAEQVGERRQGERECQRQARGAGHEKTDDEDDERRRAGDERYQDGGDGDARRSERPRERGSVAPRAGALVVKLPHDLERHEDERRREDPRDPGSGDAARGKALARARHGEVIGGNDQTARRRRAGRGATPDRRPGAAARRAAGRGPSRAGAARDAAPRGPRRTSATPGGGGRSLRSRGSACAGRAGRSPAGPRRRPGRRRGSRSTTGWRHPFAWWGQWTPPVRSSADRLEPRRDAVRLCLGAPEPLGRRLQGAGVDVADGHAVLRQLRGRLRVLLRAHRALAPRGFERRPFDASRGCPGEAGPALWSRPTARARPRCGACAP